MAGSSSRPLRRLECLLICGAVLSPPPRAMSRPACGEKEVIVSSGARAQKAAGVIMYDGEAAAAPAASYQSAASTCGFLLQEIC